MSYAFQNVTTCDDVASFRSFPAGVLQKGYLILINGNSSFLDGQPGIYVYDPDSSASDDGFLVLKQTGVTGNGRAIRQTWYDPTSAIVPTGAVSMFVAAAAPSGWLLCDGSAISRTTYATLYAIIGTTYGMGDGSTTFNVPDMRQRFPIGKASSGTGDTLGETGGTIDHDHNSPITTGTPSGTSGQLVGVINVASATHTHDATLDAQNPPYLTVNFIIKI